MVSVWGNQQPQRSDDSASQPGLSAPVRGTLLCASQRSCVLLIWTMSVQGSVPLTVLSAFETTVCRVSWIRAQDFCRNSLRDNSHIRQITHLFIFLKILKFISERERGRQHAHSLGEEQRETDK